LPVIALAQEKYRCIVIDLPGIGESKLSAPKGDKFSLARIAHELIERLSLRDVTLVGHDIGGMIAFAYLKQFSNLRRAVIMDTVMPGIPPWQRVLANPHIWHFAFSQCPNLPEELVKWNVRAYFDYFYDGISARKTAISYEARSRYAASYSSPGSLTQGFEFYRAFEQDAMDNLRNQTSILTPTLYLRGSRAVNLMNIRNDSRARVSGTCPLG
jgi:pimeloyl-ACP methyl ester carboxylesterase